MNRIPVLSLWLAASSAILYIALGPASEFLVYQREAVQAGELGRLATAHFSHSDGAHLAWNLIALLILGSLLELREGALRMMLFLLAGVFSVNLYIAGASQLTAYCGLSGVLNALLAGVLASYYREPALRKLVSLTAAAAVLKIFIEISGGHALLTQTAWPSVPHAHLWGFAGGLLLAACLHRYGKGKPARIGTPA